MAANFIIFRQSILDTKWKSERFCFLIKSIIYIHQRIWYTYWIFLRCHCHSIQNFLMFAGAAIMLNFRHGSFQRCYLAIVFVLKYWNVKIYPTFHAVAKTKNAFYSFLRTFCENSTDIFLWKKCWIGCRTLSLNSNLGVFKKRFDWLWRR